MKQGLKVIFFVIGVISSGSGFPQDLVVIGTPISPSPPSSETARSGERVSLSEKSEAVRSGTRISLSEKVETARSGTRVALTEKADFTQLVPSRMVLEPTSQHGESLQKKFGESEESEIREHVKEVGSVIQPASTLNIPSVTASEKVNSEQIGQALKENKVVRIYSIRFDFDKSSLRSDSMRPIFDIAVAMHEAPEVQIIVEGHTDGSGGSNYNLGLSQRRAVAVVDALVNLHQIDRSRLTPIGKGESQPIETNVTARGRAMNRRVELKIR